LSYRLVVIDIDGTLLNDAKLVSEETFSAIRAVIEKGVYVALCTGRGVLTSNRIRHLVPKLNAPSVLNGGALISDISRGRFLYVRNLSLRVARDAVSRLRSMDCHPIVYSPLPESQHFYFDTYDPENDAFSEYVAKNEGRAHQVPDVSQLLDIDPAMVAATDRVDIIRDLESQFRETMPEATVTLEVSPIDRAYCHVTLTPRGVSKGSGLRQLASLLNVDMSETLALGDNLNDLDMMTAAGLGIAMGNATEETKALADHVTESNNDDGVARALEQFVLEAC